MAAGKKQFQALESWRGICALLIAVFHFPGVSHLRDTPPVQNAWLAVDFFFALSGFVIAHAYGDRLRTWHQAGAFLLRRFGRLYPLHFAMLVALVLFATVRLLLITLFHLAPHQMPFQGTDNVGALVANVLLVNAWGFTDTFTWNGPSWSISVEWAIYLLFAAVVRLSDRWYLPLCASVVVGAGAAAFFCDFPITKGGGLLFGLFGFFLGVLSYALFHHLSDRRWAPPPWLEWPVLGLVLAAFSGIPWADELSATICFAIAIWFFAFEAGPVSTLLKTPLPIYLGLVSYSIYLTHGPIIQLINTVLGLAEKLTHVTVLDHDEAGELTLAIGGPWIMDAALVVFLVTVVAVSGFTYRTIENPARNYFNRLATRRINGADPK